MIARAARRSAVSATDWEKQARKGVLTQCAWIDRFPASHPRFSMMCAAEVGAHRAQARRGAAHPEPSDALSRRDAYRVGSPPGTSVRRERALGGRISGGPPRNSKWRGSSVRW
jgi:hypothetical protein